MDTPPVRLRGKASWLINKISLQAHRLLGEHLTPVNARGYHFAILAALAEYGPASQIAIGQRLGVDRSDTHAMVTELAEQGLIRREPDPQDRRRNVITITDAGVDRLDELDKVLGGVQEELLRALSPAERRQLIGLLGRVFDTHYPTSS
jgi:DNA-binding MarR family transcriptional regulator